MSSDVSFSPRQRVSSVGRSRPLLTVPTAVVLTLTLAVASEMTVHWSLFPAITPLALLAAAMLLVLLHGPRRVLQIPVPVPLLLLLGWMLFSYLWSENRAGTEFALRRDLPLVVAVVLLAGLSRMETTIAAMRWLIRVALVVTAVTLVIVPETRASIDPEALDEPLAGWRGGFVHKNVLGPFLALATATVLGFERRRLVRRSELLLIAVLVVGTQSLTGLLGALLALATWWWFELAGSLSRSARAILKAWTAFFVVLGAMVATTRSSDLLSAGGKDPTFTGRTQIWRVLIEAWSSQPLLGYGHNGVFFDQPLTPLTDDLWRRIGFSVYHGHNGPLDVGVQLGLVGLALFAWIIVSLIVMARRVWGNDRVIATWVVSVVAAQGLMALSEDVFLHPGWLSTMALLFALLHHASDVPRSFPRRSSEPRHAPTAAGAASHEAES